MLGFLLWESRIENPLIKIDLFRRNRVFVLSNISVLINYASTYAIIFFLSLYLQYIKGLNPSAAGLVLAVQPATQAILSPITGKITDKVEPRVLASLGMGSVVVTKTNNPEFVASTLIAFSVFAILCLIGVFTSLSRGKVR